MLSPTVLRLFYLRDYRSIVDQLETKTRRSTTNIGLSRAGPCSEHYFGIKLFDNRFSVSLKFLSVCVC
ncbi:hypothetical protein PEX2_090980 [Penicillium expansum]|uniref:Uncharacterized protein n=1 Tax=Penicillium expansum TaxID=27334 RepID=A0A0A2JRH6_PENEN|nr:hypothetical protein PEX2_090980 [Penicillium expansum]KGO54845.1 hypothetical protein PEX2_090980 [Penicillium expansum]